MLRGVSRYVPHEQLFKLEGQSVDGMSTLLKKIGEVLHLSHDKKLVLKLATVPPLYIPVYDYSMRRLGVLYDVIGPVKQPYGLVKPDKTVLDNPQEFVGKAAYVRVIDLERAKSRQKGGKRR